MLKNEIESYIRIGGRGLKNLTYSSYMGAGGVKICKIIVTQLMNGPLLHANNEINSNYYFFSYQLAFKFKKPDCDVL